MSERNNEDLSVNYHDLTIEPQHPHADNQAEDEVEDNETHIHNRTIMEGLLFITGDDGLTIEQAAAAMEITPEAAQQLLEELMETYAESERGFEIEHYGKTYRFLSRAVVHESARRLFQIDKEAKLSNAAMETLAIIAYRQPITRVEIEEIRGVGADVMLRKLEARGLIQESGRSDAPGKPFLYTVTDEFLNAFGLTGLEELPDLPSFAQEPDEDLFQ